MASLLDDARKFWNAAFFYRRAPDRDRRLAVKVLQQLRQTSTGRVFTRTDNLMKEIENGASQHPPIAG